jgi:hypothetical protein
MLKHQFDHSADRDFLRKCFLVFSFLPYLAGRLYDDGLLVLVLSLILSTIAIVASIYSWRHGQDIRYLIMAFLVSALPIFLVSLLYIFLFFFAHGL